MSSRPIASGDYAIIEVVSPAYTYKYLIRKISSEGIYIAPHKNADCSLLINTVNGWQVYQYQAEHTVSFKSQVVDLLSLNYYTLMHRAQLNSSVQEICNDDNFWYEKLVHDYGLNVSAHKPAEETYKQQYEYLHNTSALERGLYPRIDGLIRNVEMGYTLSTVSANQALAQKDTAVLEWLQEKGIYPTQKIISIVDVSTETLCTEEFESCAEESETPIVQPSVLGGLLNWWYQK